VSAHRPTFLVTGADLAPAALALLKDHEVVYAGKAPTEDDIVALCRRHDPVAIIVRYGAVGAKVMDAAPSLRVISKHGSGTDTIDKAAAAARGVAVVAAAGANAAAVAEHALALLLACAKSVVQLDQRMHAGHWDKATHKSVELEGRSIGLVGIGAIGLRFAKMADALGMRVLGFDPFAKNLPDFEVPPHLRNAPTKLMSELGYGAEYRYAHDEPGAYAAGEQYFPPELAGKQYYQPTERGLEKQIAQKLDYLHELDKQSPRKR